MTTLEDIQAAEAAIEQLQQELDPDHCPETLKETKKAITDLAKEITDLEDELRELQAEMEILKQLRELQAKMEILKQLEDAYALWQVRQRDDAMDQRMFANIT